MIESLQNSKIKQFLKLLQYKKYRNTQNKFALEGFRAINDAINFKVKLSNIFLTRKAFTKFKMQKVDFKNYNLNLISDKIAKKVSSVEQNQGCFATVEKLTNLNLNQISTNEKVLALFELNNPGNLGTLIRSAAAFNFKKIILADCCDIYNPKVIRSSMSALFKIQFIQCSQSVAINWLKSCKLNTYAATVSKQTQNISEIKKNNGCVLVIGSEANGLNDSVLKICKKHLKIQMANEIESLNAAIAGSILMFELTTNKLQV